MAAPSFYPVNLAGPRVSLREVSDSDTEAARAWATDPEFFRFLPFEMSPSQEAVSFLRKVSAAAVVQPREQYELGVIERETGQLVGMARLGVTSFEHRTGDLGYGLRRDRWGQGLATEAAGLMIQFGFEKLRLHRIFAYFDPNNGASGRVLE